MNILLIFGGPSSEKAISLNSARSVCDHMTRMGGISLSLMFVTKHLSYCPLDKTWLYCNTTEDFEFKIDRNSLLDEVQFLDYAKKFDLVFPLIHGEFGEDGVLQKKLEQSKIPFIGSLASSCEKAFLKSSALALLKTWNLHPGNWLVVDPVKIDEQIINKFMTENPSTAAKYIIKPDNGGSSIGVNYFSDVDELKKIIVKENYASKGHCIIEPFYLGQEFSICIIEIDGQVIPLVPCSIHYENGEIFDFRKKYLPSQSSTWSCPGKFSKETIDQIRSHAKDLFKFFNFRHWVRLDGWVFSDGRIAFSDINLTTGIEQNSLIFIQGSYLQLSHDHLLKIIIQSAVKSYGLNLASTELKSADQLLNKTTVRVLFGGQSAERQVSLLSGTNVWLKLTSSKHYTPCPYFLSTDNLIYKLPYHFYLYHTVEEIEEAIKNEAGLHYVIPELKAYQNLPTQQIEKFSINEFLQSAKDFEEYVFLALHGGEGEDGTWQEWLEAYEIPFNGSYSEGSKIGMDKKITADRINGLNDPHLVSLQKTCINFHELKTVQQVSEKNKHLFTGTKKYIIKPQSDGCSNGIIVLTSIIDLEKFALHILQGCSVIPKNTFYNQMSPVVLPIGVYQYLIEDFIETDKNIELHEVVDDDVIVELTVGVLEHQDFFESLEPSYTIADGAVLSLEEKFQGGTGINLTPVPFLSHNDLSLIKLSVEKAAAALKIKDYARVDLFYIAKKKLVILIEVNTLPALTPSTVLFHQALAHSLKITPLDFLELIIKRSKKDKENYYVKINSKMNLEYFNFQDHDCLS